jgi:hypothetical protein
MKKHKREIMLPIPEIKQQFLGCQVGSMGTVSTKVSRILEGQNFQKTHGNRFSLTQNYTKVKTGKGNE